MQNTKSFIKNMIEKYPKLYKFAKDIKNGEYFKLNPLYYLKQIYYCRKYGDEIRINIGSGPNVKIHGWLTLDYAKSGWAKFDNSNISIDINEEVSKGVPLKTKSVLAVYSSHFLEHLNWWEGMTFLREMYRILKMGGQ